MHTRSETLRQIVTVGLLAVPPIGCAARPTVEPSPLHYSAKPAANTLGTQRRADVVSGTELRALGAQSATEGLKRLRPEFLRPTLAAMDQSSPADRVPVVYVDGVYIGRLESLDYVPLDAVQEIRFLRPMQGVERWGPGCHCAAGVIHVLTRPER